MDLKNKRILVTGSSSGIGQAIAIECAKSEAEVLICYRKNKDGAVKTLTEVEKYSKGMVFQADLSNQGDIKILFKNIAKDSPYLDALINNAGESPISEFDDLAKWESLFRNNFFSMVGVANEFIKMKGSSELRKIINISSINGLPETANPLYPQYSATKAAVNSLTSTLAKKFAPGILVNSVAPGYTWTPEWEGTPEEEMNGCKELAKIKRFIKPVEIASVVMELLRNDAITGEVVRVDGGLHLQDIF